MTALANANLVPSPAAHKSDDLFNVCVTSVRTAARRTKVYRLASASFPLPRVGPGDHIDVHLGNGLIRQYSLLKADEQPAFYEIAVQLDEQSRGGSLYMHENVGAGAWLRISKPRNTFPLNTDAKRSLFIAGGIGITPIWCMLRELRERQKSWQLFYACRSSADAAFLEQLRSLEPVHLHFDDENDGRFLDVEAIVREASSDVDLYCCGPAGMMSAFENATAARPHEQVHVEYFSPKPLQAGEREFIVQLVRSGKTVPVSAQTSILHALQKAGLNLPYSCEQGICGTCETAVIAGSPDHRDQVLTEEERASNNRMMICCSRSFSDCLVLDL